MSARVPIALLALLAGVLFLEVRGSWLIDPDECRYAEIAREMRASGDYVIPRLNQSAYLEKPPLLPWLEAAAFSVGGETPYAARLPVRLATIGIALALLLGLRRTAPPGAGAWAAVVYLSSLLPVALGRTNIIDPVLTFAMTLVLLAMRAYAAALDRGERGGRAAVLVGGAMGLSVLAKGLIGIVLPLAVFAAWTVLARRPLRDAIRLGLWSVPVALAVPMPWFLLAQRANPAFFDFFFVHEHFLRYITPTAKRPGPPYYFLAVYVAGLFPWSWWAVSGLRPLFRREKNPDADRRDDLLLIAWIVVIVAFFSVSKSKLIPYVLPVFPAAAILVGKRIADGSAERSRVWTVQAWIVTVLFAGGLAFAWRAPAIAALGVKGPAAALALAAIAGAWAAAWRSRRGGGAAAAQTLGTAAMFAALTAALPAIARDRSFHDLAESAAAAGPATVVGWDEYPQSFPWVLKRPVVMVGAVDELASDRVFDPALFWTPAGFSKAWASPGRFLVVVPRWGWDAFRAATAATAPAPRVIAENRKTILASNFEPPEKK